MSELSDQMRDHFEPRGELHQVRQALAKTMNAEEWVNYREVANAFEGTRRTINRDHELSYASRVDAVQRRLIDEAASVKRDFVPRFLGSASFDKTAINTRAQNEVRSAHSKEIAGIDKQECRILRGMMEGAQARANLQDRSMKDFQCAVDRRNGQDRRSQSWKR